MVESSIKVYKGTNPEVDSYSVFWDNKKMSDTSLCGQLKQKGITDVYVCGLAYDVCVGKSLSLPPRQKSECNLSSSGATATDALSAGYRTVLIDDCCRGVDLQDIETTKETVLNNHGVIVHSKEVKYMFVITVM
jgi:nicotinamidase-related amidase